MTEASAPAARRWWQRTTVIALATALVALASGALGLVFDLHPELRPDPRSRLGASMDVFAEEPNVSVDDWLQRLSKDGKALRQRRAEYLRVAVPDSATASRQEVSAVFGVTGRLFYVRTTIEGFKRRSTTLRWSMYDWRTRQRLADPDKRDVSAADFTLEAPSDSSVALIWTPSVFKPGWYFVRFELVDKKRNVLAVSDSPRFRSDRMPR